jgi:hypothetical protein
VYDALDGGCESFCRRNRSVSQGVHWNRHENAKEFEILNLPFMWFYFNKGVCASSEWGDPIPDQLDLVLPEPSVAHIS